VLFLCTGNSARSQIAEALLVQIADGTVDARSAGSNPKPLHPDAVRVMHERGIDISANRTKHLDEFLDDRFDVVITLCDRVREVCPEFPSHPRLVHWSIPDPAREGAIGGDSYPAFERTATELETRVGFLMYALCEP
jgi:protein-tyrosine-phosphatase